jgi:hypothetical protein
MVIVEVVAGIDAGWLAGIAGLLVGGGVGGCSFGQPRRMSGKTSQRMG